MSDLTKKLHITNKASRVMYNTSMLSLELSEIGDVAQEFDGLQQYDAIFAHTYTLADMKMIAFEVFENKCLNEEGVLFFLYPKKGNKAGLDFIHRDDILPYLNVDMDLGVIPGTNLYFNKMVSLNEVFTIVGMKNLKNPPRSKNTASGRVGDYVHYIPQIEEKLASLSEKFKALTPGKQREWARHIYSAMTEVTQNERFNQLIETLNGK